MIHQPVQPVEGGSVLRFRANAIVKYLSDLCTQKGLCDMNQLAILPFSREDRVQFAQLIGYSVSGFTSLPYVTDEDIERANDEVRALTEHDELHGA